jgi:hypothetical protein
MGPLETWIMPPRVSHAAAVPNWPRPAICREMDYFLPPTNVCFAAASSFSFSLPTFG